MLALDFLYDNDTMEMRSSFRGYDTEDFIDEFFYCSLRFKLSFYFTIWLNIIVKFVKKHLGLIPVTKSTCNILVGTPYPFSPAHLPILHVKFVKPELVDAIN